MIRGELLAVAPATPRFETTRRKLNPMQAAGIRYEKKCRKALDILAKTIGGRAEHAKWFEYTDSEGKRFCQVDHHLILDEDLLVIVETKTTWVPTAESKLRNLYVPILRHLYRPNQTSSIVLCKHLVPGCPQPIPSFVDSFRFMSSSVYHWPEIGPLLWNS